VQVPAEGPAVAHVEIPAEAHVEIPDTLSALIGCWQLVRSIEDHLLGQDGWFVGTATLATWVPDRSADPCDVPCDPGWLGRYEEVGTLQLGAYSGLASRRLRCRRLLGGEVRLQFEDGRHYVDLDLRTGYWHATHRCGDDRYELSAVVRSPEVVEAAWRVRGPSKHYDATTRMVRVPCARDERPAP
jgi:hypothetical protein